MKLRVFYLLILVVFVSHAQSDDHQKVFLITLDGLRWQELFSGADSLLVGNEEYVKHTKEVKELAWRPEAKERREILFPFIWGKVSKIGQLHGNRNKESFVNLTNNMWFSYPGYNEILTGKADDERINSNSKKLNPNVTVLEEFAQVAPAKKVAAFGSWDVFDYIVNESRSNVYTNNGFEPSYDVPLTEKEQLLNELQRQIPSPWGSVRLDGFTHQFAKIYIEKHQPDLVYISYGETDDFAHDGDYESYLKSARNTDALIEDLWNYVQSSDYYKDKTTFIITTDHGRGTQPIDTWRSHGTKIKGADQTWLILFGNAVAPKGEISQNQVFTNQVASTVRSLMGLELPKDQSYGSPIPLK